MMDVVVPVNYLAVLVAAAISVVVGSVWYGPLFGKPWMEMMGIKKPEKIDDKVKAMMAKSYSAQVVGSLVTAYVLAHVVVFAASYTKTEGISAGLMSGFWNWLGFVAPISLGAVLWEGKPMKLWVINSGYWLVTLCLMGVVLAVWK